MVRRAAPSESTPGVWSDGSLRAERSSAERDMKFTPARSSHRSHIVRGRFWRPILHNRSFGWPSRTYGRRPYAWAGCPRPFPAAYKVFSKKVLDLFFYLWHKGKVNGRKPPGPKPAKRPVRLAGFCAWGRMKEGGRMQRQRYGHRHGQGGGVLCRIWIGGWRSRYGGILPQD